MSEMVERVAKAIAEADQLGAVADGPGIHRQGWRAYVLMARAAIEALREPTQAMIRAGEDKTPECRCDVDRTFSAMIDAALRKETT